MSHHAYIYEGGQTYFSVLALDARERFGFEGEHNPDVSVRRYEKFGIEESRELSRYASLKNVSGRALYILGVSQINSEAQQALLKLFEEPGDGIIFVLLAPHGAIISTLRSRMLVYPTDLEEVQETVFVKKFLASPYKIRSEEIAKLLKDEEGVRERMREFLNALEKALHASLLKTKGGREIREGLEDIARVRSYAGDRSPSLKMLLEHLALSLPTLT